MESPLARMRNIWSNDSRGGRRWTTQRIAVGCPSAIGARREI